MTIEFDLDHNLDLEFSKSNTEIAISQQKMRTANMSRRTCVVVKQMQSNPISIKWSDCHETKSKFIIDWTIRLGFDLGHDLDLESSRSNMEFAIFQPKMVRLPQIEKQSYWLNSRPQMRPMGLTLGMTLTLNFQDQLQNLLYLTTKWSDCHKMKNESIDWTLGFKCSH